MKKLARGLIPLLMLAGACKSEPPPPPPTTAAPATTTLPPAPSVGGITLGNAVGPDKKVAAPSDAFGAKDTIYASVDTAGTGPVKLRAVWSYVKGEKTAKVDETTIEFDSTGPGHERVPHREAQRLAEGRLQGRDLPERLARPRP